MADYAYTSTGGTFDSGWIHARVEVTRSYKNTDTSVLVTVKCYAVPTYSSVASDWLKGKATKDASGNYGEGNYEPLNGSTVLMKTESFYVTRETSDKTITCRAYVWGYGGGGIYDGDYDEASVKVTIPKLASYVVSYNGNKPSTASSSDSVSGLPSNQTKWQGINLILSKNIPSLTNHNFKGWAELPNGSVIVTPGATYTYSGNASKTYYAIWELAYILPNITNIQVFRTAQSTSSTLYEEGTFMRINFSWSIDTSVQNNGITVTISAKLKNTSETTYKVCAENTYTGTSDNYSLTLQFKDENNQSIPFATESSYDIKIEVTDTYGGTTIIYRTLSQSYVLLDFSPEGGIGVGMIAPSDKQLDIGINTNINGALTVMAQKSITNTAGTTTNVYNGINIGIDDQGNPIISFANDNNKNAWLNAFGLGTSGALPITIAQGGTGATTPANARSNLGIKAISLWSGSLTGTASTTFSYDYNLYIIFVDPDNGGSSQISFAFPKTILTTSDQSFQVADDALYTSFYLKYSTSNSKITLTRRAGSGSIKRVYGII